MTLGSDRPTTIDGITLYGPDGVVAAFRRDDTGQIVEVDPDEAVVGVAIDSELRSRWLTARDTGWVVVVEDKE